MAKETLPRTGGVNWTSGTDPLRRVDMNTVLSNYENRLASVTYGSLASRPTAGQARRIYVCNDTANIGAMFIDTGTAWVSIGAVSSNGVVNASANSKVALTVIGAAAQVAPLTNWQKSDGAPVAQVASDGSAFFRENYLGFPALSARYLAPGSPSRIGDVIIGATGQTADLSQWRSSSDSVVARVSSSGSATFNSVTAQGSLTVQGGVTAASGTFSDNITTTASLNSKVMNLTNPTAGSVTLMISDGTSPVAGVLQSGNLFAKQAIINDVSYAGTDTARIKATANVPVISLIAAAGATLPIINARNSADQQVFSVDPGGSVTTTGRYVGTGYYVGPPQNVSGTSSPAVMDVATGTGTGTYKDYVIFRHPQQTTTAVDREVVMALKLSTEDNSTESARWAGISAKSNAASANAPYLSFYTAGSVAGLITAQNHLSMSGEVRSDTGFRVNGSLGGQLLILSNLGGSDSGMGVENVGSYFRSEGSFNFYKKGVHTNSSQDPGTGGSILLHVDGDGTLEPKNRLYINNTSLVSSTSPAITLGTASGVHITQSNNAISSWNANKNGMNRLYLQTGSGVAQDEGGAVTIGTNSDTSYLDVYAEANFKRKYIRIDGHRVFVQTSAPGQPLSTGDVWIDI